MTLPCNAAPSRHEDLLTTNTADMTGKVTCDLPHSCIYDFNGYYKASEGAKPVPLDASNLLLRGCALRNTEWVIGVVAYAGADTKAMLNNSGMPLLCSWASRGYSVGLLVIRRQRFIHHQPSTA